MNSRTAFFSIASVLLLLCVTAIPSSSSAVASADSFREDDSRRSNARNEKKPRFELVTVPVGDGAWGGMRYNRITGESWKANDGRWVPITEFRQLRPAKNSDFIVQVHKTGTGRISAIRMDQNTGDAWALKDSAWHPILDAEE